MGWKVAGSNPTVVPFFPPLCLFRVHVGCAPSGTPSGVGFLSFSGRTSPHRPPKYEVLQKVANFVPNERSLHEVTHFDCPLRNHFVRIFGPLRLSGKIGTTPPPDKVTLSPCSATSVHGKQTLTSRKLNTGAWEKSFQNSSKTSSIHFVDHHMWHPIKGAGTLQRACALAQMVQRD